MLARWLRLDGSQGASLCTQKFDSVFQVQLPLTHLEALGTFVKLSHQVDSSVCALQT
jgi:hypothetical protein